MYRVNARSCRLTKPTSPKPAFQAAAVPLKNTSTAALESKVDCLGRVVDSLWLGLAVIERSTIPPTKVSGRANYTSVLTPSIDSSQPSLFNLDALALRLGLLVRCVPLDDWCRRLFVGGR